MIVPDLSSCVTIGREPELQLLHDIRRELGKSRGSLVLIGGEAGIGKTRLLTGFASALSGNRAPMYAQAECAEHTLRPFGPVRQILRTLRAAAPAANAAPLVRRTLAALVPDGADVSENAPAELAKAELFTGVLHFLESVAAKRAVVIAVEDVHWADAATLELLVHLAPRIAALRIMLLATFRDDQVHPGHPLFAPLSALARERNVRRIALEPLDAGEAHRLIRAALGGRFDVAPDRLDAIVERGQGNPFFIEELLKDAIVQARATKPTELPLSVRATILKQLETLDADARHVLEYAAVLGQRFSTATLGYAVERPVSDVLPIVRRLRDLNVVIEEPGPRSRVRFRHALTREAVYDGLLTADMRALHARIVTTLEAAGDPADRLDELAHHTWEAGLHEQARRYNEAAGDAASGLHAAAEARHYFSRALELVDTDADRMRLLGKVGDSARRLADFDAGIAAYLARHEVALRLDDWDTAALSLSSAVGEMCNSQRGSDGLKRFEAFVADYGDRLSAAVYDHVHAANGRGATFIEDYASARRWLDGVRDPARLPISAHHLFWTARMFLAMAEANPVAWFEAVAAARTKIAELEPLLGAQFLHTVAMSGIELGETAIAEEAVDAAIAADTKFGFARLLAYVNAIKAGILFMRGRLQEARRHVELALVEPELTAMRTMLLGSGGALAAILSADDELARRCMDAGVIAAAKRAYGPEVNAGIATSVAAALEAAGRTAEMKAVLDEALDALHSAAVAPDFFRLCAQHADAGRVTRMRALIAAVAGMRGDRVMAATAELVDAIAADRSGDRRAAREHGERAAGAFRAIGWPLLEARSLEAAGQSADALAIFQACGSVRDVRRLERHESVQPSASAKPLLTARERAVAELITRGLTNRAIGGVLGVGEKRVEKHASSIYAKLGISTRVELAAHVARDFA